MEGEIDPMLLGSPTLTHKKKLAYKEKDIHTA